MECHTTQKHLEINTRASIGTIIIVVEGERDEFDLFKVIFQDILHYNVVTKPRNGIIREFTEYTTKNNQNNRVIILNTRNSNIASINEYETYRDGIYRELVSRYAIDPRNCPTYYVWDRDRGSNRPGMVRRLLETLYCSQGYNDNYEAGLLLLSYPALEAYTISCMGDKDLPILPGEMGLKEYCRRNYSGLNMSEEHLVRGVQTMHKRLLELDIKDYNLDNFAATNLSIFDREETIFSRERTYVLLSLISIILIDCGIVKKKM